MRHRGRDDGIFVSKGMREALADYLIKSAGWRRFANFDAFDAIYTLVGKGCDGVYLVSMLDILTHANQENTWKGLTGFSSRDTLQTGLKRLRNSASDIDHFLEGVIGKSLFQKPAEIALPENLRGLADQLEHVFESITPKTNLVERFARAAIVWHVYDKTGKFCDELVATILTPAIGACDAVNHVEWRSENENLINLFRLKK